MTIGKDHWLMERHLEKTKMKSVVNDMSPKCEVEQPCKAARSTPRMSKQSELINLKEKIGPEKYNKMRYNQTKNKEKMYVPSTKPQIYRKEISDLCLSLSNCNFEHSKNVGKKFQAIIKQVEKKQERKKDHFKNKRWKRYLEPQSAYEELIVEALCSDGFHQLYVEVLPESIAPVVEYSVLLNGLQIPLEMNTYADMLVSQAQSANEFYKKKKMFNHCVFNISEELDRIMPMNCPHCSESYKCATCILDNPKAMFTNHQSRVIEDIIIAACQVFYHRNVRTFVFEFVRIIKTMYGTSLINFDYIKIIPEIINTVVSFMDGKVAPMLSSSYIGLLEIIDYLEKLFKLDSLPRAQSDEEMLGSKPIEEMGWSDTLLSDWMETDMFQFVSNWFCYLCYVIVSKESCKNIPIFGDVMKSTIKYGKEVSYDILKYIIKTIEFILKKGSFMLKHGFITTFYHNKSTLISLRTRFDRLCELYACKNNPAIYGMDPIKFAADLHKMRKELTDLSRVGTQRVREEICKMLTKVIMMDNDVSSDAEVFKERPEPFSLLIWGKTSIAKSTFLQLTIKANCDVHDLEYKPEKIYTSNDDERMDGLKTDMDHIVFDDCGNKHPNVCPNGDSNVNKIIKVRNTIAYVTEQAALEDKSKIPVHSPFFYVTSNTEHLNTMYYLTYPAAVLRRFNYIIELKLKPKFAVDGMFEDKKAGVPLEDYKTFDFWDMHIGKYKPGTDEQQRNGKVVYDTIITNINDYFVWLAQATINHKEQQERRFNSLGEFAKKKILKCGHFEELCSCHLPLLPELKFNKNTEYTHGVQSVQKGKIVAQDPHDGVLFVPQSDEEEGVFTMYGGTTLRYLNYCRNLLFPSYTSYLRLLTYPLSSAFNLSVGSALSIARWSYGKANKLNALDIAFALNGSRAYSQYMGKSEVDSSLKALADHLFPAEELYNSFILKLTTVLTTLYVSYRIVNKVAGPKYHNEISTVPQGAMMVKEKSQFWVDQTNVLKDCDVSASSLFYKDKEKDFINIVASNCVILTCELDRGTSINVRAICLGGWCYVANAHCVKNKPIVRVKLIQDKIDSANSNICMSYSFDDALYSMDQDLVYFYLKDNRPKRNISRLFYRGDLNDCIFDGCYIGRELDGSMRQIPLKSVRASVNGISFPDGQRYLKTFSATVCESTVKGDCGMPMIVYTSYGPSIVGIHVTGYNCIAAAAQISVSTLSSMSINLGPDVIAPKISFPSKSKNLITERKVSHPAFLEPESTVFRFGSIEGGGARAKSNVERTPMADKFEILGYKQLKSKPPMNHYNIFHKNLLDMTVKSSLADEKILKICSKAYLKHLFSSVSMEEFDQLGTISLEDNINGIPSVDYMDKVNRNTSAGFPWCESKKKHMIFAPTDRHPEGILFSPEIEEEYYRIDHLARSNILSPTVYQVSQKDEPLPHAKCQNFGTRLFFGAPLPKVLFDRKYFLPLVRLFQRNRLASRTAIGTVVQSSQWGDIADFLKWHDRIVAGDYSKFDKKQQVRVLREAFNILIEIATYSKRYSEVDLIAMEVAKADIVCALVSFDGDLLGFMGVLPSGNPLTTLLNCLCNILLDMYAFVSAENNVNEYFELVMTLVYGDDSISSVSPLCKNFDHTIKQRELAKIGIVFTMAEKDRVSVPFISLSEATFLKRKFVFDESISSWMAPLDENNIVNSLIVWVKSKNITPIEQAQASMQNSIREFFFHGKCKFEEMSVLYKNVYRETYHEEIQFPEYDEILEVYLNYSSEPQGSNEYIQLPVQEVICYVLVACGFCFTVYIFLDLLFIRYRVTHTELEPQGSVLRKRKEESVPLLLHQKFNKYMEEDGIERIILDYYGVCKILSCSREMYEKKVCCLHYHLFNKLIKRKSNIMQPYFYKRICFACGQQYWIDSILTTLCIRCWCYYNCLSCSCSSLCSTHMVFSMVTTSRHRYYLDVIEEVNVPPNNVIGFRGFYFRNHHRALGIVIDIPDMDLFEKLVGCLMAKDPNSCYYIYCSRIEEGTQL
jgi:hypothetical protein